VAQHDYVIANGTGAAVRSDLNNGLAAIVSQNSGTTEPTTTYAYMRWADTTAGVMKMRNGANNAWITLYQLDGEWSTIAFENGSASAPSIYFKDSGTDTGIYSPGTDQVAISTGGTGRLFVDSSGRVGLGTSSPGAPFHVSGSGNLIRLGDATNTFDVRFTGPNNWDVQLDTSADKFNIRRNSSSLVTVDGAGRLGIGTTAPQALLNVAGTSGYVAAFGTSSTDPSNTAINIGVLNGFAAGTSGASIRCYHHHGATGQSSLAFETTGSSEVARFDTSGRFLVGTSSARANFFNSTYTGVFQIETAGNELNSRVNSLTYGAAGTSGPLLVLAKHRSDSVGAQTVVQSGDEIGVISFQGSDGSQFVEGARISAIVDAAPGSDDMPGRLVFSTTADGASSPTERLRIRNNGNSTLFDDLDNGFEVCSKLASSNTGNVFTGYYSATSTTSKGTASIVIRTSGNILNANNSYGSLSDIKLKENIVDANSQWDDLKALQIRNYNFRKGQTHTQIGLIAQEVELVSPGLVNESPDRDADGNDLGTVTKSVNYSVLYMKAVKALQEAMERIETLEAKVAALEAA
jgi:hypothetical protein